MTEKKRLDQLVVERGLAETRSRAQALILAGSVWSGDRRLDKPGASLAADTALSLKGKDHPWVSRGGVKLAHALDNFKIDPKNLIALDIGASTGGFTDVLLQRGAKRVYAVDVGHGQLDWNLRNDKRVKVLERVNARYLSAKEVPEPVDLVTCDASFIGLETVLPAPLALAKPTANLVALIKPQFEVGPKRVGKGGVVRDTALHEEVCARISAWVEDHGWRVLGVIESPLKGPEGNTEFLLAAERGGPRSTALAHGPRSGVVRSEIK
jgi:23S rRNA (cytidine1920-2'-O)/16S rRNA (cytidine1409-2'-O)-methyltransferase